MPRAFQFELEDGIYIRSFMPWHEFRNKFEIERKKNDVQLPNSIEEVVDGMLKDRKLYCHAEFIDKGKIWLHLPSLRCGLCSFLCNVPSS